MKVAVVQMNSGSDPWFNLLQVMETTREAASKGCQLVCFPENVFYRGPKHKSGNERPTLSRCEDGKIVEDSDFASALLEFLRGAGVWVSLGSVAEKSPNPQKTYNCQWLVDPEGRIEAYHKVHLFQLESSQVTYREMDDIHPGQDVRSVQVGSFKLGLSICYDLRFPELYRILTIRDGANVLLVPSAFLENTGRYHWSALLKARAIENLSYVLASAQWGSFEDDRGQKITCYGHSAIFDPWGKSLAEAPERGDCILMAHLDIDDLNRRRQQLPALENAIFRWRET